jgi:hypothetical protein
LSGSSLGQSFLSTTSGSWTACSSCRLQAGGCWSAIRSQMSPTMIRVLCQMTRSHITGTAHVLCLLSDHKDSFCSCLLSHHLHFFSFLFVLRSRRFLLFLFYVPSHALLFFLCCCRAAYVSHIGQTAPYYDNVFCFSFAVRPQ